tara:strand:+ start:952 stop:1389 length:438 start_codon:yes stop_codon:yes gene_type:complete
MLTYYLLLKSLHIIAFTSWMAGMFYLPRIYVYHSEKDLDQKTYQKFLKMEKKLIKVIMTPSMIITWLLGILLLLHNNSYITELWLQIKLILVLFMSATHGFYISCFKKFLLKENKYNHKFFRIINEIPTLLLISIVFLVIFGPSY